MSSGTSTEPESLQPWQLFTLAGLAGRDPCRLHVARAVASRDHPPQPDDLYRCRRRRGRVAHVFAHLGRRRAARVRPSVAGRTRAALEREKALALRSLKELEFDRAMRKVSEKDFGEMGARLRARAAGLIRQLDASEGYRDEIEKELANRLAAMEHGSHARRGIHPNGPCRHADRIRDGRSRPAAGERSDPADEAVRIVRHGERSRRAVLQALRCQSGACDMRRLPHGRLPALRASSRSVVSRAVGCRSRPGRAAHRRARS